VDKLSSHITPPSEGTTAQKNTLTPRINQKFFDTDLGKEQQWDGTTWKDVSANLPPRQGVVGLVPTTHWRINVTKVPNTVTAYVGFTASRDVLFLDSAATVKPAGVPTSRLIGMVNFALGGTLRQPQDTVRNLNQPSGIITNGVLVGAYVELVYPAPIAPLSSKQPAGGEMLDYTIQNSYDGGVTWNDVATAINDTPTVSLSGKAYPFPVPTYPANPADGQRFFNTSLSVDTRWDANLNKWVEIQSPAPWKLVTANMTARSGSRLMVDTTATPVSITLPLSPILGDEVTIHDVVGNFATNNVTVLRNTNTIMGLAQDLALTINNKSILLAYTGTDWRIM